jgi:secretion/DNA translocation related TadE-like protein
VVAAAIIGVVCSVTIAVAAAAGVLVERHRLTGATDAAALAAADAAAGVVPGVPCDEAERVAEANRVRIVTCLVTGADAEVEATSAVGAYAIRASARAGQPPSARRLRTGASKK